MAKAAHTARVIMAITAVWPCVRLLDGLDTLLSPSSPEIITASPFASISRVDDDDDDDEGADEGTDKGETDGDMKVGAVVSTSASVTVDPLRPLGIDMAMLGTDMATSGIDILK
jgi:hypothetical protein